MDRLELSYKIQNIGVFLLIAGYLGFHPNPFGIGIILGFGGLFYRWVKFNQRPDIWKIKDSFRSFFIVFLVFSVSFLLPAFFSLDENLSLSAAVSQMNRWRPCFFVLILYNNRKEFFLSVFSAFALGELSLAYGCWQDVGRGAERFFGEYGSPNILAAMANIFLPWCVGGSFYFIKRNRNIGLLGIGTSLMGFAVVLYSASRGAILAIALTLVFLICIKYNNICKNKRTVVLVGIICIFVIGVFSKVLSDRYANIISKDNKPGVIAAAEFGRIRVWKSAILMFKDYPLTGVGLNNFNTPYKTKYLQSGSNEPFLTHAHNIFLQNLAEMGLLGSLGFWGVLFFQIYYLFIKTRKFTASPWLICGLAVFLIGILHNMVDYFFATAFFERMLWLQWGICYAHGEFLEQGTQKNIKKE